MSVRTLSLQGTVILSLLAFAFPAVAAPAPADMSIADRPGTASVMNVRVFNNNANLGSSAYGVSVTVRPIAGVLANLSAPSGCARGGNGSYTCSLNRVDAQYAKFLSFGIALSKTACGSLRNGQIKVATATVSSTTPDSNSSNNATNVYVQASCQ